MNVEAYLNRIHYHGSLIVSEETLRNLQVAHLRTVPFENLSIHAGQPIVLDDHALFEKIVSRHRGGFCYELNGLFATFLSSLGFQVQRLAAGVARAGGGFSDEFDHMTLLVTLDHRWLADVGFGDSFSEPLRLDTRAEQVQGVRAYQLIEDGPYYVMRQRDQRGEWKDQYRFTLTPREYREYEARCHYQQTSPESHFTQGRVCTLATSTGRITLSDAKFITTHASTKTERSIHNEDEFSQLLRDEFGISESLVFRSNRV